MMLFHGSFKLIYRKKLIRCFCSQIRESSNKNILNEGLVRVRFAPSPTGNLFMQYIDALVGSI